MKARLALYFLLWVALVAILTLASVRKPERLRSSMTIYAVVTWVTAVAVVVFEETRVAVYVRRAHPFYYREIDRAFRARNLLIVGVRGVARAPEFVSATDTHGDPLLPVYRQRARRLRWVPPIAFAQSAIVMICAVVHP